MPTVFLNGEFLDRDSARVSAFDAGFQHGVGLFETFTVACPAGGEARPIHLTEHLERLAHSARELSLSDDLRVDALREAVVRTIARAREDLPGSRRLRVRLTITGGDLNLLEGRRGGATPTVLIVATPATGYPEEMFEHGVGVVIADHRANPLDAFASHKTLGYWARLRELQVAAGKGAGEALVFQVTNHLAGGCVSSAILVRGEEALVPIARGEEGFGDSGPGTPRGPAIPSPVLPGVTRQWALDELEGLGLVVRRRMLTIADVLGADEVLLTNSSWGVLPVVRVEREGVGIGEPGARARELRRAWLGLLGASGE